MNESLKASICEKPEMDFVNNSNCTISRISVNTECVKLSFSPDQCYNFINDIS